MRAVSHRVASGLAVLALAALVVASAGCDLVDTGRGYSGRVFVYVLGGDADGVEVPALVLECSTDDEPLVRAHDALLAVTIPGTSYTRLREAYPFGGGAAVSDALVRTTEIEDAPYVVIDGEHIDEITGRVTFELAGSYNSYVDGHLYVFGPGKATIEGAAIGVLLESLDYMSTADRVAAGDAVGAALAEGLSARGEAVALVLSEHVEDTDLSKKGVSRLLDALSALDESPEFVPAR